MLKRVLIFVAVALVGFVIFKAVRYRSQATPTPTWPGAFRVAVGFAPT